MPTLTLRPSAGAVSPVDGTVGRYTPGVNNTFSNIRGGAGTYNDETAVEQFLWLVAGDASNRFIEMSRAIFCFDTSSIPDNAIINSATLSIFVTGKSAGLGQTGLSVSASTPASTSSLSNSDYGQVGSVSFSNKSYGSVTTGAHNAFVLDSNGIDNISKTGISKFALRLSWDMVGSFTGSWSSIQNSVYFIYHSDVSGTSNDPKLTVDYTLVAEAGSSSQIQPVENVTLVQSSVLSVNSAVQAHEPDLIQMVDLDIAAGGASLMGGASGGQLAPGMFIYYPITAVTLTIDNVEQAQSLDQMIVQLRLVIPAVDNVTQTQSIDNIVLTFRVNPEDIEQNHSLDNIALTQKNTIEVADSLQTHSIDDLAVVVGTGIVVDDSSQDQTIEDVALVQSAILQVQEISQGHSLGLTLVTIAWASQPVVVEDIYIVEPNTDQGSFVSASSEVVGSYSASTAPSSGEWQTEPTTEENSWDDV